MFIWNAADLVRKLDEFKHYYNAARVHRGLASDPAAEPAGLPFSTPADLGQYGWQQHCRGLFQVPIAA